MVMHRMIMLWATSFVAGVTSSGIEFEHSHRDTQAQDAQSTYCTFTNHGGDQCVRLDLQNYTRSWCTGRAKGQVGTSCVRAWIVHPTKQVFEEATGEGNPRSSYLNVDWAAQRGEAEHTQVALRSYGGSFRNISLIPAANQVGLPVSWLSARQVGQVFANSTFVDPPRGAGWWPDPLLPFESMVVEKGAATAIWLTVAVPVNATPGHYYCNMLLSGQEGVANSSVEIPLKLVLQVWNLTLPPVALSTFSTFFQFQYQAHPFGASSPLQARGALQPYYGAKTEAVKELYFKLLCQSRMPPIGYQWLRPVDDMTSSLDPSVCTGRVEPGGLFSKQRSGLQDHLSRSIIPAKETNGNILFSIMSISDLFGHKNPSPYNATYFKLLWDVLDPVVSQLNNSGVLHNAVVYGFDEAHPKAVFEPLIAQLFGAVRLRYHNQLMTMATLHYCPSLDSPIDILVQSYANFPYGTNYPPPPGGSDDQYCKAGFPATWTASTPRRRYFFYHCFSPRSASDTIDPFEAKYGAMNSFVDYPRIHNRLMPWWAAANEGVSGWLYFEVSEWRVFTGPSYPNPKPYDNHSHSMIKLPSFVNQPNDGFIEARVGGGYEGPSRLTFNVNKYYANIYGGGTTAGDGIFIYPGRYGPIASSRSETWRDGVEDFDLFARLPYENRKELIFKVVQGIDKWNDDSSLESTRREAAQIVMSLKE